MGSDRARRKSASAPLRAPAQQTLPASRFPEIRSGIALAVRLQGGGRHADALDLVRRMLAIEPHNPELHFLAATLAEQSGDLKGAAEAYRRVIQLTPRFLPAIVNLAACLFDLQLYLDSERLYRVALDIDPELAAVRQNLAQVLNGLRRPRDAMPHLEFLARQSGSATAYGELAEACDQAGEPELALKYFREAMGRTVVKAPFHVKMATVELARGSWAAARSHLEAALKADPDDGYSHMFLAQHFTSAELLETRIADVEAAIARSASRPLQTVRAPLEFALAHLREQQGEFDAAFAQFRRANDLYAAEAPKDDERREKLVRDELAALTPERLAARRSWGDPSRQPVFVFGMPRSGTTLIEQVLVSHPEIGGLGELELIPQLAPSMAEPSAATVAEAAAAYLKAHPSGVRKKLRVTDKSIGSWQHLGAILLLFPQAKLINCLRHPLDVCWSIYSILFNQDSLVYAYDFERLARHFRLYCEVVDHWRNAMPGRILDVRYEDMVASPKTTARRLVAHLELDWDPGCLNFHETPRAIRTASMGQVRRPLYSSAIGKWRRYERHLRPLRDLLAAQVDQYERNVGT